jgi:hypothetical protein
MLAKAKFVAHRIFVPDGHFAQEAGRYHRGDSPI